MYETASLVIKVDSTGARRATDNLDKLDRAAGSSERAANKMGKAWGLALGYISSAVIIGATRALARQVDTMANLNARLGLVTSGTQALAKAQADVFAIAQRTSTDLEATADLYVKLAQGSDTLRGDQERLAGIVQTVSEALVVSGADAASTTAVIRQFAQALASGSLRGDEFVSVMEGAPRLARAIADGLQVPIGSLRQLAAQGDLTAEKVIAALESQRAAVEREFGKMPITIGRAMERVENSLQMLIGGADESSKASASLGAAISSLADALSDPQFQQGFRDTIGYLAEVAAKSIRAATALREYFGLADKRSTVMLRNQRDDLEGKLFAEQRSQGKVGKTLLGQTMLPGVGPLLGAVGAFVNAGDQERIDNLRRQIAEIDAIIDEREKKAAQPFDPNYGQAITVNGPRASGGAAPTTIKDTAAATRDAILATDDWTRAQIALEVEQGNWGDRLDALQAQLSGPLATALNDYRVKVREVDAAVARGAMTDADAIEWKKALAAECARSTDEIGKATDKMSVFADQAARNIQSSLGDSLYEILGGKFDSIADRFSDMLRRIAAEAASAKIFEMLGTWASGYTGAGAGWINALGKAATSMSGGRAGGGPVMAGQSYWVGDGGKRELFTPSQNGTISQGGGAVTVKPIINVSIERGAARDDVQAKPNGSGGMDLIVKIAEQVERSIAGNISQGSGPVGPAMKQRYGLREAV